MSVVGHVSRPMLKRYSHIGKAARRRALENMRVYRDQKREEEIAVLKQFESAGYETKPVTVN